MYSGSLLFSSVVSNRLVSPSSEFVISSISLLFIFSLKSLSVFIVTYLKVWSANSVIPEVSGSDSLHPQIGALSLLLHTRSNFFSLHASISGATFLGVWILLSLKNTEICLGR